MTPGEALFISGQGVYHGYRLPSLTVTKVGLLLAFCEGRGKSPGDSGACFTKRAKRLPTKI